MISGIAGPCAIRRPSQPLPMRWSTTRALPALFCFGPGAVTIAPSSVALDLQRASRLWISGSSTVGSFACSATAFDANVESVPTRTR